ncbi:MAG TPA: hypothetical protein DEA08_20765 [Planctomycetes bacterium]|nr:hypothetical protein [Planctomycetota bacterium]|tara:strand:- start:18 stop:1016 length:999 start_codon:yes stop_codon:yes gene_type:complete
MRTLSIAFAASLLLCSPALAGGEGWLHNLEEAKKKAKAENKDILIDFTGSDWCGWCIRLKKEVWDTEAWKAEGPKRYVLVELDYPRKTPQSEETKKYNDAIQREFGVRGFPTIALLDSEGQPYGMTGYQKGGPEAYLKHLEELAGRKGEIKQLLEGAKDAKALDDAMQQLAKWRVAFGYPSVQEKIVELDPKNEAGFGLKHAKALAMRASAKKDDAAYKKHLEQVRAMDSGAATALEADVAANALIQELESKLGPMAKSGDWAGALKLLQTDYVPNHKEGAKGQVVGFFVGICKIRSNDKEGALAEFRAAKAMAEGTRISKQIDQILKQLGG